MTTKVFVVFDYDKNEIVSVHNTAALADLELSELKAEYLPEFTRSLAVRPLWREEDDNN
jgi:hypothetical protein